MSIKHTFPAAASISAILAASSVPAGALAALSDGAPLPEYAMCNNLFPAGSPERATCNLTTLEQQLPQWDSRLVGACYSQTSEGLHRDQNCERNLARVMLAEQQEAKGQAERQKQAQQQEQARQATAIEDYVADQSAKDTAAGYQRMTPADFIVDGKQLAQAGAKVSIIGTFVHEGNVDRLYLPDIPYAARNESNGIPLMTSEADRNFRLFLLNKSAKMDRRGGIHELVILGHASMCTLTNLAGTEEVPCVLVADGWTVHTGTYGLNYPSTPAVAAKPNAVQITEMVYFATLGIAQQAYCPTFKFNERAMGADFVKVGMTANDLAPFGEKDLFEKVAPKVQARYEQNPAVFCTEVHDAFGPKGTVRQNWLQ